MDFEIVKLTLGSLATNCYLLIDKKSRKTVIIDPGDEADYIHSKLTDLNCIPELIFATHGHFDHILAAYSLKQMLNVPFAMNKKDVFLVSRMEESAKHFLRIDPGPPPEIDRNLTVGNNIGYGSWKFRVIEVPGHTPGSVCLYNATDRILFSGDLIFQKGVGRTDFEYSDSVVFRKSLTKILNLSDDVIIFPGHGEETTIGNEKEFINQYLKLHK